MTRRVDYLDGIRALAIGGVLAAHWVAQYLPLGHGGHLGVDVFFVLSGFVITTVMWRSRDTGSTGALYRSFLWRRVKRLYPALLGLVVVSPIAVALVPGSPLSVTAAAERAGLATIQATWIAEALGHTTDPFRQTWSLAIEWYFYLLWPIVVFALKARGVAPLKLAKGAALAAALIYVASLPMSGRWFYVTPPARFAEILAGAVLALVMVARPDLTWGWAKGWLAALALGGISVYVVVSPWHYTEPPLRWIGIPLAVSGTLVLIAHGYSHRPSAVTRLLTWAPMTLVGRASYSLYLWHWLPLYLLDKDSIPLPVPVLAVLGVGLAAAFTTASYVFLEKPFMSSRAGALQPRDVPAPSSSPTNASSH